MAKKRKLKYGVYDLGVQKVAVQQPDYSDVLNPAISLASAGSQFGPWGAVIGGAAGLAKGVYDYGKLKQGAAEAEKLNTYIDTQNKFFGAKNPYETPIPVQRNGNRGIGPVRYEAKPSSTYVTKPISRQDIQKPIEESELYAYFIDMLQRTANPLTPQPGNLESPLIDPIDILTGVAATKLATKAAPKLVGNKLLKPSLKIRNDVILRGDIVASMGKPHGGQPLWGKQELSALNQAKSRATYGKIAEPNILSEKTAQQLELARRIIDSPSTTDAMKASAKNVVSMFEKGSFYSNPSRRFYDPITDVGGAEIGIGRKVSLPGNTSPLRSDILTVPGQSALKGKSLSPFFRKNVPYTGLEAFQRLQPNKDGNRGVTISDDEYATGTYSVKAARAGKDIGKPGKQFSKIAASAAKKYGSKEAGERVAGAILARLRGKRAEDGLIAADEKPVEVERNELIFRKDGNGKFNLAADFKGGRTHEQGGEPYIAEEGDIIFPGKLRRQVMDAYNRGDSLRLNSLRLSLPKDNTPRQFKHGVYGIEDEGKRTVADVRNALEGYTPPQSEESDAYGVEPSFLDQAVTAAPSIYNIATGVFGKVQKPTRRFYSPESLRYEDLSAPSRQSALRGFKGAKQDIANVSGGSAATYLGNVGQAYRSYQDRLTDINLSEAARRDATSRYNVEGRNRAQMVNLELAGQYDIEEQQAREAKRKFVTEGLTGLSGLRQLRMKRKGLSERDALLAKALAGAF